MIPATKQYPRPILPLLRQRIKRRDQRQMVKHRCRLKAFGYGHLKASALEAWGKPSNLPLFSPDTPHYRPPEGGLVTHHNHKPVDNPQV